MTVPKHEPAKKRTKKQPAQPQAATEPVKVILTGAETVNGGRSPSMRHRVNVDGLNGVEESLDWIARSIGRLTDDESPLHLNVAQGSNTNPIQITLADDDYGNTMDRLVTAFERIADSVAKLAGLERPRLEAWHEQDEYEPRYKNIAGDGGAPGPKTKAA
jgi:hypothetical protein